MFHKRRNKLDYTIKIIQIRYNMLVIVFLSHAIFIIIFFYKTSKNRSKCLVVHNTPHFTLYLITVQVPGSVGLRRVHRPRHARQDSLDTVILTRLLVIEFIQ